MIVKDFNMVYTVESAQPLAFYSDYSSERGTVHVSYTTVKGAFNVVCRHSGRNADISYNYEGRYTDAEAKKEIIRRFGLKHEITEIYKKINTDSNIDDAIRRYYGMRVTQNDPWEAALSFVVSQFNNVKRIRRIMRSLISRFGSEFDTSNGRVRLFPEPSVIADASIKELMECGTGFRASYIKSVAAEWQRIERQRLASKSYEDAKLTLMELDGIGDKVADCILLMGYGKLEAFPIDTWIKRLMERDYLHRKSSIRQIHDFAEKKWGAYAGYAQQYIYWYGRNYY